MNIAANPIAAPEPLDAQEWRGPGSAFSLVDVVHIIRVRRRLILGIAAAIIALIAVVSLQITSLYRGEAVVILDARKNSITDVDAVLSGLTGDQATIQNQIQILESRSLLAHVVDKAHLVGDPEFGPAARGSAFAFLRYLNPGLWFGTDVPAKSAEEQARIDRNAVIARLLERTQASPIGLSQAIEIAVRSENPEKAARIANAIADVYVEDQLNAKFEATQRATRWLSERLGQLNAQVQAADAAVAQYKADNNLVETAQGSLVEQQLGDLNSQLIVARSSLAEAQAKYARVRQLQRAGRSADVSQVVDSPLINQLRGQEADLLRQEAELLSRYGSRHPKVLDLVSQKQNLQAKIALEVMRVVQTVASDASVAQAKVSSLQASLNGLQGQAGTQNQARVKLKQLEANAASTRALHDAFLSRFKETQDQTQIQAPDARILSRAAPADSPSYPPRLLIFGLAIPGSLFLGFVVALLAERLDSGFRTTRQVERTLGLPVIATVPELTAHKGTSAVDVVVNKPLSAFAESIRGALLAGSLTNSAPAKVILVTSAVPGEGKTTIAASMARLAARNGQKVILIEGDLRKPNVTTVLGMSRAARGIVEALQQNDRFDEFLQKDPRSDARIMTSSGRAAHAPELLGSRAMENLVAALRRQADLVIIDSAPLLPVNDTKLLAKLADTVFFVVQWQETARAAASAALRGLIDLQVPIAGVIVARADPKRVHYYNYGSQQYAGYAKYYTN